MIITKKYDCQTCFKSNEIDVELTYCSETTDLIEDCYVCCNPNTISYTTEDQEVIYFQAEKTY